VRSSNLAAPFRSSATTFSSSALPSSSRAFSLASGRILAAFSAMVESLSSSRAFLFRAFPMLPILVQ